MLQVDNEKIPITPDEHGKLRVTGTRVPLERVVTAFELGSTPEQIVQSYDTLKLDDVYAVITYYLRHQKEVNAYFREREAKKDMVRQQVQADFPTHGLRERLLRRRKQKES